MRSMRAAWALKRPDLRHTRCNWFYEMSFIQSRPISFSLDGAFATLVAEPNVAEALPTSTRVYQGPFLE